MARKTKVDRLPRRAANKRTGGANRSNDGAPEALTVFYWAFVVPRWNLRNIDFDRSAQEDGTPPPRTHGFKWGGVSLGGVEALDRDMENVVLVESELFAGRDAREGYRMAQAFARSRRGKKLRENSINGVLYQFVVFRGPVTQRRVAD